MPYCPNCGNSFSIGDTHCSKCGINLQTALSQEFVGKQIYNFSNPVVRRIIAASIDYVVVICIMLFIIFYKRRVLPFMILGRAIALLIPPIYFLIKDSFWGKSLGKLLMGIKVFNKQENKRGGLLDSIIRNWYLVIPIIGPTIFAFIMAIQIFSGQKQRIGDKAANTIVILDKEYS